MKRTRHTPAQVIRKLREADRMLAEHKGIAEIAKELADVEHDAAATRRDRSERAEPGGHRDASQQLAANDPGRLEVDQFGSDERLSA